VRKQMKGYGFYLVILAIIFATVFLSDNFDNYNQNTYNYLRFVNDVNDGKVSYVDIYPNEEVYTGEVKVRFSDRDGKESFHVLDVREIENIVKEAGIEFRVHDISKPNWFLSSVLPYVLVLVAVIALFSFLTNQAAVGGGNNKVMNFGKSRAKLMTDTNKTITFKNVAGLDEEKEELWEIVDFLKSPKKIYTVGSKNTQGSSPCWTSGNRKNSACQGCSR